MTFLQAMPLQLHVEHYIELLLILFTAVFFRSLKKKELGLLLPLSGGLLVLDLVAQNLLSRLNLLIKSNDCAEIMLAVFGFLIYKKLYKNSMEMLVFILIEGIVLTLVSYHLPHNINYYVLANLNLIIFAPLTFILFWRMLNLRRPFSIWFRVLAVLSMAGFIAKFIDAPYDLNNTTAYIFLFEALFLTLFYLIKLVIDETMKKQLIELPQFWFCALVLFYAIAQAVFIALAPYFNSMFSGELIHSMGFLVFGYLWVVGIFTIFFVCAKQKI